ncbi:MAG: EamA family transporter [Candidatus Komeilibacteria bacterium]
MAWVLFGILAAVSFGFYNFFTKISADKLNPIIALVFITGSSFLVALVIALLFKLSGQELVLSKNSISIPILAGVFTGIAEMFYLFMFTKGAPLSIGNPLVVGGTIIVAVLLGMIIIKEPLSWVKAIGILVTLLGVIILSRG